MRAALRPGKASKAAYFLSAPKNTRGKDAVFSKYPPYTHFFRVLKTKVIL